MKRNVVIGFLGVQVDAGSGTARWNKWRPTVALCQHEDWLVHRLELIHGTAHARLADQVVADIAHVSPETTVRRHVMDQRDPWDFEEVFAGLHDLARGHAFDTETENYFVQLSTGTHVAQICMFLLAESRHIPARLLQLIPPRRWSLGEPGGRAIIDLDLARYDRLVQRFADEQAEGTSFLKAGIATRNAAFNAMIAEIETVAARSKAPILLLGPTGAGKSELARRIHALKRARHQIDGPFVEVNCATLRGDNAMSALFGHRKGAFTGAVSDRAGHLRAADGGMLFLDEIGELGADEQAMILRAVERKRFHPLGSDKEATSDFQLIAGTNRDLGVAVRDGGFRADLYARLNLWTFMLPSLAERPEDIAPNIDFELRRLAETGQQVRFSTEALARYLAFARAPEALWTGNFRDLGASLQRMATLCAGGRITSADVDAEIVRLRRLWRSDPGRTGDNDDKDLLAALLPPGALVGLDRFDAVQLAEVARVCRASPSLSAAGRVLFEASRKTRASVNDADRLRKYLARFGLSWRAMTQQEQA